MINAFAMTLQMDEIVQLQCIPYYYANFSLIMFELANNNIIAEGNTCCQQPWIHK